MAREFANTSGSPNIDYITYSGVPPVASLGTCSIVARIAGDSDWPGFGHVIHCRDGSDQNKVAIFRNSTASSLGFCFSNGAVTVLTFPFTFDGTMRSVIATFDGSATPKYVAYVDGVSQTIAGTPPSSTTIGSGQTNAGVGGFSGFRNNGRVADVAIYNRVITPAEALIHAAGYTTDHFPRGRIFCAPLIREVHDIVGGLTGTITGTTVSDHPRVYA